MNRRSFIKRIVILVGSIPFLGFMGNLFKPTPTIAIDKTFAEIVDPRVKEIFYREYEAMNNIIIVSPEMEKQQ